jgi:hypothetical protein
VRYLLVVATPVEVTLYAVSFGSAAGAGSSPSSVHECLHLHATPLSFATGGVVVQKIAGTSSGRIFLAGEIAECVTKNTCIGVDGEGMWVGCAAL